MTILSSLSHPVYEKGKMISQIVHFSGQKKISKISINITVHLETIREYIIGSDNFVSFQAANWKESRNPWAFQPISHWSNTNNWETSGTSIYNYFQTETYSDYSDIVNNAPYLKYHLYLPDEGVYDLWGYGYTSSDIFWSWNNDSTNIKSLKLSSNTKPMWTKFGTIYVDSPKVCKFCVFLGTAETAILDQWYFTKNTSFSDYLSSKSNGYTSPLDISKCPFNTALRVRNLNNGMLDDLEDPYNPNSLSVTSWEPNINTSGEYNYIIRNNESYEGLAFEDGISLEYWQIGGDSGYFSSWNYRLVNESSSVGNSFTSVSHGKNFVNNDD